MYAQIAPSFPAVKAKSFFVEEGSSFQLPTDPTYNNDALVPLAATDGKGNPVQENDSTYSWYRYNNAGFRFHYSNYMDTEKTLLFGNYLQQDTNVFGEDQQMFDSYIRVYGMGKEEVPAAEADDYVNDYRGFDATSVALNSGLLKATTWDALGANAKTGLKLGNALTTIQIQAYVPQETAIVPDFTGMTYAEAQRAATALGFVAKKGYNGVANAPEAADGETDPAVLAAAKGHVATQRLADGSEAVAGSSLRAGSVIELVVNDVDPDAPDASVSATIGARPGR